jgi:predicted transcriptional regulator of viral defense system
MGLATPISVETISTSRPSNRLFLFGIQRSEATNIDPLELLQTYNQSGLICYFSALSHLGLTSQLPTHHHIASLTRRRTGGEEPRDERRSGKKESAGKSERSKMGTLAFSYNGIPFYSTKRLLESAPGIKTRILSPLTKVRMTTIEQTLLDTLQYPYQCGGTETVFEAWESRIESINEELMLTYLKKIQIDPLTRRLGAILNLYNYHPKDKLDSYLKKMRGKFIGVPEFKPIGVLRGIEYSRLDSTWNVTIP